MDFCRIPCLLFRFRSATFFKSKYVDMKQKHFISFISCKSKRAFSSIQRDTSSVTVSGSDGGCTSSHHACHWSDRFLSANDASVFQTLKSDCVVYGDFICVEEENALLTEIEPYLKRLRYEHDHWDNAIHAYRETERKHWNEFNKNILNRVKSAAFEQTEIPLPYTHVLDIEKDGYIKPHVDSVRFCGRTIAGLSLLSPSVMRLALENDKTKYGDLLLLPRSLYIMRDKSRYEFTHELLPAEKSEFKGNPVLRDRRISIIQRLKPENDEK